MIVLRLPARFPLRAILALMLGVLHAMAFSSDAGWAIEIAALAALFALLSRSEGPFAAGRTGFAFGLGWFGYGVSWVYISMHTYGGMPAALAATATLLFCTYLAAFYALAAALSVRLAPAHSNALGALALLPTFWTGAELARGYLFTGFPWLAGGYAHVGGPLAGFAPLIGVYGVGLISALLAACLAAIAPRGTARRGTARNADDRMTFPVRILLLVGIIGLPLAGVILSNMTWSVASGAPLSVRLLQGNVAQEMKFSPDKIESSISMYLDQLEARRADIIVLPETAFPLFLNDLPDATLRRIQDDASRMNSAIALGTVIADGPDHYTNSLVAFAPGHSGLQRYDKSHLVPFGEFVPTGFHWFVRLMKIPLGDFARGTDRPNPMTLAGHRVGFDICYEDLFGEEIAREADTAEILANVSNVGWFGNSLALPEHLQIARMRALETARPMVRATNTGMTASIDPHGRVLALLPPFVIGSLEASVVPMSGTTPYVQFGQIPAVLLSLLLAIVCWVWIRKKSASTP